MIGGLTIRQKNCLDFLIKFTLQNNGISPSFDEILEELDLKSKSGVHRLIKALEERGYIERQKNARRAITIIKDANNEACGQNIFNERELKRIDKVAAKLNLSLQNYIRDLVLDVVEMDLLSGDKVPQKTETQQLNGIL